MPLLLLLCALSSVMTTSLFFSDIYTTVTYSTPQQSTLVTERNSNVMSNVGLVRKSAAALPIQTYRDKINNHSVVLLDSQSQYNYTDRESFYSDTNKQFLIISERSWNSVFKTWNRKVITQTYPSLRQQNCSLLMSKDSANTSEMKQVVQFLKHSTPPHQISFANLTNCTQILHEFLDNFYTSESERSFPLAFTLVVHTNAHQILRFLKAIYRPQNVYCIHPDLNAGSEFIRHFMTLKSCLPNVIIPSRIENVNYKRPKTILQAQLSCLKELVSRRRRRPRKWKYVINLCGRELPMKTNRFIVRDLMRMEGVSILKPYPVDNFTFKTRFSHMRHKVAKRAKCKKTNLECVKEHEQFMHNNSITLYKSMTYNALSFQFVHHLLHDPKMQQLTQWMLENCSTPEEHLYATAYMIPGVPGGYNSTKSKQFPLISKSIWKHDSNSPYHNQNEKCAGKIIHQVCIMSSADLPMIGEVMTYNVWFLNKYFMEDDHIVMDCVEERLINANKWEFYDDHGSLNKPHF